MEVPPPARGKFLRKSTNVQVIYEPYVEEWGMRCELGVYTTKRPILRMNERNNMFSQISMTFATHPADTRNVPPQDKTAENGAATPTIT